MNKFAVEIYIFGSILVLVLTITTFFSFRNFNLKNIEIQKYRKLCDMLNKIDVTYHVEKDFKKVSLPTFSCGLFSFNTDEKFNKTEEKGNFVVYESISGSIKFFFRHSDPENNALEIKNLYKTDSFNSPFNLEKNAYAKKYFLPNAFKLGDLKNLLNEQNFAIKLTVSGAKSILVFENDKIKGFLFEMNDDDGEYNCFMRIWNKSESKFMVIIFAFTEDYANAKEFITQFIDSYNQL